MRRLISILILAAFIISSSFVFADVAVGDVIVVLGADLTESQKEAILKEFNSPQDAQLIFTTNEEEHEYLGGIIPSGKIGTNAISCVMITYREKGNGLNVDTSDKINYITEESYISALITAGVEDADIKITAPVSATGTAALTGIMKAYEISTGEAIDKDIKRIANEEMVTIAELGEVIGNKEVSDLVNRIKQEIADKRPNTRQEVRDIVLNIVTNSIDVNLTDEQIDKLVSLFDKMKELDIDWNKVSNQVQDVVQKASDFLSSEEGQGFLQDLKIIINKLIDWIASLFR